MFKLNQVQVFTKKEIWGNEVYEPVLPLSTRLANMIEFILNPHDKTFFP